ncbi:hypothetical protein VZT92_015039 [Zoarces viviparus]|uniref:Uncharacterized protein n=1 Tax=Zoarces viviparus TaxID=48416 RepID=A0AAW1EVL1_ZOAVI
MCDSAFNAARRRHFGALQARLPARGEYKRAESSVSESSAALPPPPQWPELSQRCYSHRLRRLSSGDKWSPAAAHVLVYVAGSQRGAQGCLQDSRAFAGLVHVHSSSGASRCQRCSD